MHLSNAAALAISALIASTTALPYSPSTHIDGYIAQTKTHKAEPCPAFKGSFNISAYQLYPENADFDFNQCLLLIGTLFNGSITVYDPYKAQVVQTIEFPGISHNKAYHMGAVAASPYTKLISSIGNAGAAFNTAGKDISGTNALLQYDPVAKKTIYNLNLTAYTEGKFGGFQDLEFDKRGNVYVVGTFPASILRVTPEQKISTFFKANDSVDTSGFGGLAATGDILLSNYNAQGSIVRFDMGAEKGTMVPVKLTPAKNITGSDAIYLPPKYNGTVLLVAVDPQGVEVLRSKNGKWDSAEALGQVSNHVPEAGGGFVTGPVQIGDSIFAIEEFFGDKAVDNSTEAGNRTTFPWVDITAGVEKLLARK